MKIYLTIFLVGIGLSTGWADPDAYTLVIDTHIVRDVRGGDSFTAALQPGSTPYTFKLIADPETNTIQKIKVYLPGQDEAEQILDAEQTESPYRNSTYFKTVDVNFDGYQDIGLLNWWGATGNEGWRFWRFDPTTKLFIEDKQLAELGRPEFDAKTQTIRSFTKGGWCLFTTTTYKYDNGKLRAIEEERCNPPIKEQAECFCQTQKK